jgi:hypothetical protein
VVKERIVDICAETPGGGACNCNVSNAKATNGFKAENPEIKLAHQFLLQKLAKD